ncbi:lysoplasmalogenase [Janibacter sp. YIM B02568]|uniref:lysoplasmalogenase n=1 Tax=Janibacter endophyticus TaxID=2806261 RepID=UPI0019505B48|nr:lysoplasmalogenase [Janibacter endophyticus]MBM6546034.1 lysoplasmalogenase [Janibacter endophyticus]
MPSLRRAAAWTLAAGAFAADWVAVATDRRKLELVAKPAAMPTLALACVEAGLPEKRWGAPVLVGQAFGLGGDVLLLREDQRSFLAGLSSFLVGHLAYIEAFRRMGVMSLAAWSTGNPLVGAGASLFVVSDTVIAVHSFVEPLDDPGLKIMVPYLLGQALVAAGAVRQAS